jgi:hypothetical protein
VLDAERAGALRQNQKMFAEVAHILIRGLAHVGIVALVDEATGYQEVREKQALQAILDRYLRKELAAWAKRFPDEFYKEMFRLRGWEWLSISGKRPSIVGTYTNDLVYERLAPGILKELEARNPKDEQGKRRGKHHQLLTDDVGHPALAQHLHAVTGFMRASATWDQFYRMMNRAFPRAIQLNLPWEIKSPPTEAGLIFCPSSCQTKAPKARRVPNRATRQNQRSRQPPTPRSERAPCHQPVSVPLTEHTISICSFGIYPLR